MLRRLTLTGSAAALVALIIGGASFASASSGSEDRTMTLTEVSVPGGANPQVAPKGTIAGNYIVQPNVLKNADGTTVGKSQSICTITSFNKAASDGTVHCVEGLQLPGGTLQLASDLPHLSGKGAPPEAIIGGTGVYDQARGQVTATLVKITGQTVVVRDVFDIDQ